MIGRRLGSYRVLERLGSGGMGQVFLAEDDRSGRRVAIKVLAPELASRPEALARFRREAEIVARLDHPNIVAAHTEQAEGVGELIVMERIEGLALDRYAAAGKLTLAGLLGLARQLAGALGAAHEAGVVHRDLKPGNVLVTPEGAVKILDFGLAKLIAGEGVSLTRAGELLGTLPYMAPEQIRGRPVDQRADLFALGVLLYEAVCGLHPFRRDNVASTISAVLGERPPPLAARRPEIGAGLSRLLERCMENEPGDRFQTAAELEAALDELARQSDEHTWVLPRPRP